MTLKKKKKNAYIENGHPVYIKTHSGAVYVDENETETLTEKLDNVTTQLNDLTQDIININDTATYAKDLNSINSIITKYDDDTLNTPYKQGLTTATVGICFSFINGNLQLAFPYKKNLIFMRADKGNWEKMCPWDLKASNVNLSKITGMTSIQDAMDIFLAGEKITTEQYAEFTDLITE